MVASWEVGQRRQESRWNDIGLQQHTHTFAAGK